jgi:hypothetical protein
VVNASLNWASIVGIVLAVGGALLYFLRSFKPALARDYDVFFAAVGLLCGGILFFQGWRLDPILQFGQFLLAVTTVFFAYESIRLRAVTTEQARRASFFDDDEGPRPSMAGGRPGWEDVDRFEEPRPLRRRRIATPYDDDDQDDYPPPRRPSRAIPERAASRRRPESDEDGWNRRPSPRGGERPDEPVRRSPYRSTGGSPAQAAGRFGERREQRAEMRRGSRPATGPGDREAPAPTRPRGGGGSADSADLPRSSRSSPGGYSLSSRASSRTARPAAAAQAASASSVSAATEADEADYTPVSRRRAGPSGQQPPLTPRDNSSRFDD